MMRIGLGVLRLFGWTLSWLPILGFWLLPLGLMILSIDLPFLRPARNKVEAWCIQAEAYLRNRYSHLKERIAH